MSIRTISTKLAIEGETQYKQALSACNAELKTLKSSLALVTSTFKGSANSMEALTAKGKALSDMQAAQAKKISEVEDALKNAQEHQKAYADAAAEAGQKVAEYQAALEKLKDSAGDTQQEQAELTAELEKWKKTQEEAEQANYAAVKGVQNWQQQLNKAKIEQNDLAETVRENNKYLDEATKSADGCAASIDRYGKEVRQAADSAEDCAGSVEKYGDAAEDAGKGTNSLADALKSKLSAGSMTAAAALTAAGTAAVGVVKILNDLAESTEEYRIAQGKLNTAFEAAGYSTETAREAYQMLFSILGDTDTAAESAQLLAQLARNEEDVAAWGDIAAGVMGTFGDALPINSLIEASNETAKVGEVTGTLADALNWVGISEDEFNDKLAACADAAERTALITDTLSASYQNAGDIFKENNATLMETNRTQAELDDTMARLGGTVAKIKNQLLTAFLSPVVKAADAIAGLTTGVSGLNGELGRIESKYRQSAIEITATATAAGELIDRLAGLEAQEAMTEGEAALYAQTVEQLKTLLPELNIELDEQTGLLAGGTDALAMNTEAWKENALARALQEKYQDVLEGQAQAMIDAAEKQLAYNDALAACTEIELQMQEVAAELQRINADSTLTYEEKAAKIAELTNQMDLMAAQQETAADSLNTQKGALEDAQAKVEEFDQELEHLTDTQNTLTGANEDGSESMKLITASAESVIDSMSSLQEAYDASYAKAMESLEGQMGLFDEMDGKAKTSIDSLIDTLNGQVSYLESYSEDIKKAMEMGVDEGLVRKLSDGSEKSAQILDAIVKGGEDDIKALNDALAKVEEGKDTFSDTVAQMETDFNGKMEELVGDYNEAIDKMDLHDESYKIGSDNMQGLINGTASKRRELVAKYTEMGNTALAAYKKAVAQASPSKKFQEAGSYDIQGIIIGAAGEKDKLAAAYGEVAKAAVDSVEKALPSDVLTDSLQESKAACEKLLTTIKGERYAVESSAAALKRLLEVENKTAAQKDAISKKVAELNEAVPTLGLAYDSVTDSINLTGEAIERLVEQSGEQQEYEARVERLSELYTEQERISMELEAAREALSQAEADGSAGVQTLQKSVTELTSAQESNAAQIAELESATAGYNTRQTEMAQKAAEMTRSFRESRTASEELLASMRGEQYVVSTAAASLRSLLAVEEKSAVQKEVIARKAAALNEALPALGLTYDSVTDSINLTGEAIEALVEKSGEQKEYEARVERLSELYAEQTQIFRELETAEDALSEAEAGNAENAGALRDTVAELTEALFDGSTQIIELEAATRAYAQQQAEAAVRAEEMTDRLGKMTEEGQKLHESYESIRKKAYDSISGQLGLFGDLDEETGLSIDSMIASLRSQVEYMNIYSSNIQQAMALGVDKGIIQKLSDGREESSKILAAIVRSGQQEISSLNAEFARVEQGKEDFSRTVAEMETDFKNKMGELVTDLNDAMNEMNMADAAYAIGVNNMLGLISGTESQRQELVDAYADAAKAAMEAVRRETQQASPSKKFRQIGSYDIQGMIQGVESQRAALEASYAEAAQAALHSMERHLPSVLREPRTVSREEQIAAAVSAAADREGGVVNHFHIGEMNVRSDADLDYIAQKLYYMQQREVRSRGGGIL